MVPTIETTRSRFPHPTSNTPREHPTHLRVKREINQQDTTNLMFIIKLLSQHVSGIIMSIIRKQECELPQMVFCTGCDGCGCVELGRELCALFNVNTARVPAPHNHSHHNQCRTPYAAVQ